MATGDSAYQPFERASGLVPAGKPIKRPLLPYEKQLCELVGCSEAEYSEFLEDLERNSYVRPAEYDHIPDIRCDPATISVLVSLAVGLLLTGVSYLLTPKPRAPEAPDDPRRITRRGRTGPDRFLQSTSFDGFADLAEFGAAIPIIWTKYTGTTGGVVVAPPLIWSRAYSLGNEQAAQMFYIVGDRGPTSLDIQQPDIAGVFIGNTALTSHRGTTYRFAWNALPGYNDTETQSIIESAPLSEFSACLTPSNNTKFGVANPVPNCTKFKPNWRVISFPENLDDRTRRDIGNDREKICGEPSREAGMPGTGRGYPRRQGVLSNGKDQGGTTFRISGRRMDRKPRNFALSTSITLDDINDAIDAECVAADEILQTGEQFIVGDTLLRVVSRPKEQWSPGKTIDIQLSTAIPGGDSFDIENERHTTDNNKPENRNFGVLYFTLCRAFVGAFRNNRRCASTEIGIRSQVWGRVNGLCHFNGIPDPPVLVNYDEQGVQFSLGTNNEYFPRVSMFRVYMRGVGEQSWTAVGPILGIRGANPIDQYHQLCINHGVDKEYEFQLYPISSSIVRQSLGSEQALTSIFILNNNANPVNIGALTIKADFYPLYEGGGFHPYFEPRAFMARGWGSPYNTETYVIPKDGVYQEVGLRDGDENIIFGEFGLTQLRLRRAALEELFGGPPSRAGQRRTIELKRETDRGRVKFKLVVLAQQFEINLQWVPQYIVITDAKPEEGSGFAVGQTIGYNVKLKVSNPLLADYIPDDYQYGNVFAVLRFRIVSTASKTLTPEERGWRIFEYGATFAEISQYGSMVTHSCDSGPEHEIVYVNQIGGVERGNYANLASAMLALKSSRNTNSVDQLRVWVKSGLTGSNSFPQLVKYLLTRVNGISSQMIDEQSFAEADAFCSSRGLFYDGAITERTNLRGFIANTAPFFLLNFAMRNGKLALLPALPPPSSAAMFTAGNIIEGSFSLDYLDIGERRPIRAQMIWRENKLNEFPRQRTIILGGGDSSNSKLETFDMSAFCTSEAHATKAGNYFIALRKYVTHAIKFKTTLDNASIGPGSVISVALNQVSASRFTNGSISSTGLITSAQNIQDGSYPIIYFVSGNPATSTTTMNVSQGRVADPSLYNAIFSVTQSNLTTTTYIVEQVELDEEGLVSVTASEYPYNALASAAGV